MFYVTRSSQASALNEVKYLEGLQEERLFVTQLRGE
jgi:hypothetical protein